MIHPGPRAAARLQAARTALRPVAGVLPAGQTVMAGVAALFADAGCRGGVLALDGVTCDPLRYVLPALSPGADHAAWYSDTHAPDGPARILRATATVGRRDGAAFLHAHGVWQTAAGERMGHLLPLDSVVAADAPVTGLGAADAWFEALPDPETNFTLFQPAGGGGGPALIARIAPAEDVVAAVERLCADHAIADARLHGLGSIDHIRFADGRRVDCLATELRLDGARVAGGRADIPIEVVDIDGRIHRGTLARDGNPVGVTLEILIEPLENA